jgi:hypothetical protein
MPGVPAHCPQCGFLFFSNLFGVKNSAGITIRNISLSCPRCGHMAQALEGTFDFDFVGNATMIRNASPQTINLLRVLQEALRTAQAGHDESEVVSALEKESPEFAHLLKDSLKIGGLVSLLLALLFTCSTNVQQSLDWNQLIDQARVYLTGAEPYPGLEKPEIRPPKTSQKPTLSRQQRRQQERRSKTPPPGSGPQRK